MGATLKELARGIHGNADRAESKRLAKLHGHNWKALRKALKRVHRDRGFQGVNRTLAPRLLPDYIDDSGPSIVDAINQAAEQVAKYGGRPGYSIVDGVEVKDDGT